MNINQIYHGLNALTIFRGVNDTPLFTSLKDLLRSVTEQDLTARLGAYSAFTAAIYEGGGNLSSLVKRIVLEDENFYIVNKTRAALAMSKNVEDCLVSELALLSSVAKLSPEEVMPHIRYDGFLPQWDVDPSVDLLSDYREMLLKVKGRGYGIFAKYDAFTVAQGGKLVPIRRFDAQGLETLYGYQRERNLVLENTRALVEGKKAANVLLYGDAGTGKSSTIKACARYFAPQGLRLIEFKKNRLDELLPLMDFLSEIPLKFIFYIDDLSFSDNDDAFCALKGVLEGSAASYSDNIAIYATSNRRHLLKETMADRMGDELHVNDTLQENMSLSARFGLTITFSKPERDLYLEIVKSMAAEYGVEMDEAELFKRAEAFAIRKNGRSPRTAKQFLEQVLIQG